MASVADLVEQRSKNYKNDYLAPVAVIIKDRLLALECVSLEKPSDISFEIYPLDAEKNLVNIIISAEEYSKIQALRVFYDAASKLPGTHSNSGDTFLDKLMLGNIDLDKVIEIIDRLLVEKGVATKGGERTILGDPDFPFNPMNIMLGSETIYLAQRKKLALASIARKFDDQLMARISLLEGGGKCVEQLQQNFGEKGLFSLHATHMPNKFTLVIEEEAKTSIIKFLHLDDTLSTYLKNLYKVGAEIQHIVSVFNQALNNPDFQIELSDLPKIPTRTGREVGK